MTEIRLQGVLVAQLYVCRQHLVAGVPFHDAAIDLQADDPLRLAGQGQGEGSEANTDFHHGVAFAHPGQGDDPFGHRWVDQEVLPQPSQGGEIVLAQDGGDRGLAHCE